MSHIRSTNSKPERIVRKYLFAHGLRYRKNVQGLPGRPDLVFRKYNTIVFVNGCFWHHHNCDRFHWPSSNREYWYKKITRNIERDLKNTSLLRDQGWNVITIWECQLKKSVAKESLNYLYHEITKVKTDNTAMSTSKPYFTH